MHQNPIVNDAGCCLLGYTKEQLLTLRVPQLDKSMRNAQWTKLWHELKLRETLRWRRWVRHREGYRVPLAASANFVEHEGRECAYVQLVGLSERVVSQRCIRRLANYDPLTGLPNRALLPEVIRL